MTESIHDPGATPVDGGADGQPINTALGFMTDVDGQITHHRCYIPATASTYTGTIYDETGNVLAQVTYPGGTNGPAWVQAAFVTPVDVTAGELYWTSTHSTAGEYNYTAGHLPVDNGSNLVAAVGAFQYGAIAFPLTSTSVDFFPDLVFAPSADQPTVIDLGRITETTTMRALALTKTIALGRITETTTIRGLTVGTAATEDLDVQMRAPRATWTTDHATTWQMRR